tara:strand:- start:4980 stop:5444 length:465 start_codon:yes stop_codon:yes gene_type:complete
MMQHEFKVGGKSVEVTVSKNLGEWSLGEMKAEIMNDGRIRVTMPNGASQFAHSAKVGDNWWVHIDGHTFCIEKIEAGSSDDGTDGGMIAPMPGKILEVMVEKGQTVESGQLLMIMEAMKMEHRIVAANGGVIMTLNYQKGDQVQQGAILVEIAE